MPVLSKLQSCHAAADVSQCVSWWRACLQDVPSILAAMTPCSKLYGYLGQHLARAHPQANHAYQDWILTYSSASYNALPAAKEILLSRLGKGRDYGEPSYDASLLSMHTRG